MATWESIIQDPKFQQETEETKKAVRDSYFEDVIRPDVEKQGHDVEKVRQSFNTDFPFEMTAPTGVDGVPELPVIGEEDPIQWASTDPNAIKEAKPIEGEATPTFGADESFDAIVVDEDFIDKSPRQKRVIADSYFNQFYANQMPAEELDVERQKFRQAYGLQDIDFSGEAEEGVGIIQQGRDAVNRLIDWGSSDNKMEDIKGLGTSLSNQASAVGDWITETSAEEKMDDITNVGTSLWSMGEDVAEFGYDVVFGMSDEEFEREYGMPKSVAGDKLGALEQFRYKKNVQKADKENITAAAEGRETSAIDAAALRTTSEQEATDITRDAVIDAATLPLTFAKAPQVATRLGRLAATAKATPRAATAIAGGEVAKNVLAGEEDILENVVTSTLIDRVLAGAGDVIMPARANARSKAAGESVVEGKSQFDDIITRAAKSEDLDNQIDRALKGEAVDADSLDVLNSVDVEAYNSILSVGELGGNKGLIRLAEDVYKQLKKEGNVNLDSFQKVMGDNASESMDNWFRLRDGQFDGRLQIAKTQYNTTLMNELESPLVDNYIRARELGDFTKDSPILGRIGQRLTDVSDTYGASNFSKATSFVADATSVGAIPLMRETLYDMATKKTKERAMKEVIKAADNAAVGARGVQEAYDKNVTYNVGGAKRSLTDSINNLRNKQKFMDERIPAERNSYAMQDAEQIRANKKFDKDVEKADADLARAEKFHSNTEKKIKSAKDKVFRKEQDVADAEYNIRSSKADLFQARSEAKAMKQELTDTQRELNRVQKTYDRDGTAASKQEVREMTSAVRQIQRDLKEAVSKVEKATRVHNSAKDSLPRANASVKQANADLAKAEANVAGAYDDVLNSADRVGEVKAERSFSDEWFDSQRASRQDLDALKRLTEEEIIDLGEKVRGGQGKVDAAESSAYNFLEANARNLKSWKKVDKLQGKDKLSNKDLLNAALPIENYPAFAGKTATDAANLSDAAATLSSRGRRTGGDVHLGAKFAINSFIAYTIGLPVVAIKTGISLVNGMAQKSQRGGLIEGINLVDKHSPKISAAKDEIVNIKTKAKQDSQGLSDSNKAKIAELEKGVKKAEAAYAADVSKLGETKMRKLSTILAEANRMAALFEDFDNEE